MIEAHLALERIYSTRGQYDRSLDHLLKATRIDPNNPTPHYRMGKIYRRLGRIVESKKAIEVFQRLKAKEPAEVRNSEILDPL